MAPKMDAKASMLEIRRVKGGFFVCQSQPTWKDGIRINGPAPQSRKPGRGEVIPPGNN